MTQRITRLDSPAQTMVLASQEDRLPVVVYWGACLPPDIELQPLALFNQRPLGHGMLDALAELSTCPEHGRGFPGHAGLLGHRAGGRDWTGQFQLERWTAQDNGLCVEALDAPAGLRLVQQITLHSATDVIELTSTLHNLGETPFQLDWLACPVLPASDQATGLRGFYGRWCQEFQLQDIPWRRGVHMRENRLGRTSHEHIPAFLIPGAGTSEHAGEVWGCQLGWSGDHRSLAEELPDGRRQLQFGELLAPGQVTLEAGQHYTSPTLYSSYANTGYNGLSWAFHRHCRQQILNSPTWLAERPVHYNCWEAIYFDHQWEVLTSIVDRAAEAGAELFVLDDGWFLNRHDDTAGLGDWHPDPNKYPAGLTPLIEYVQQQGLRFGLWVEPEMVNKDSDLYRSHPDWILDVAGYDQVAGRHQYVLDLTRPEVVEYLFESLRRLLAEHAIDYLKWDMNRSANLAADQHGRAVGGRQVHALYQLLARLRDAFPHVVIESCSSGGGRIDLGILRHTDRFWLSDSNDAHERWQMQRNASLLMPPEVMGSHVGPAVCHTSGRRLSMHFRAPVAASRHMGFELDPREMSAREADTLRLWSDWYKSHRELLHHGRHFRLECTEPGMLAEMFVQESTGQTVVFAAQLVTQQHAASQPLRLAGLQPGSNYRLQLVHNRRAAPTANRDDASPLLRDGGVDVPGAVLMQQGIILPNSLPDTIWVIEGQRLPAGA